MAIIFITASNKKIRLKIESQRSKNKANVYPLTKVSIINLTVDNIIINKMNLSNKA